jgi:hypothetical protein
VLPDSWFSQVGWLKVTMAPSGINLEAVILLGKVSLRMIGSVWRNDHDR